MSRFIRTALVAVIFSAAMSLAAPAFAQNAQWESVDVIAQDGESDSVLIVAGTLPASVKLPAQVELSVPGGSSFQWAGEVLGGHVDNDPSVKTAKTTKDGLDIYAFTLTQGRQGQVEVLMPVSAKFDGTEYDASLSWASTLAVPKVRLSVRVPAATTVTRAAQGATLERADGGYAYYTREFENVKPGDVLALEFGYRAPAAAPQGQPAATAPQSPPAPNNLAPLVLALVAIAGAAAMFVGISRKMQSKAGDPTQATEPVASRFVASQDDGSEPQAGEVPDGVVDADTAGDDLEVAQPSPPRRLGPVGIMVAGLAVVVVVAITVISFASGPRAVGGTLTKSFGGEASACTSASIPLVPADGVDLNSSSDKLFAAFTGMQGVGSVTLNLDDPQIDVEFCESTTSEQAIRDALSKTGLVGF